MRPGVQPRAVAHGRGHPGMIEVHDLHKHFGGFRAVDGASLSIRQGPTPGPIGATRGGPAGVVGGHGLHKHFGGFRAVDGASLSVRQGSITGLIGPNGAGKTTLFNVIAGRLPPTSGRVTMAGEDITGLPPHELFHKGLLRTFQIAHEFSSMTVRENLMMVPPNQVGESIWSAWFARGRIRQEEAALARTADAGRASRTLR